MELLRDRKIEEQFQKLVTKFLSKNETYNMKKFIGGLPVTLERKDMNTLMLRGKNDKNKYTVTQKVDGTRVLMYIGPDSETASVKQRTVCFIDRNMKIYTIRNDTRDILPYVNTREMLLDGELVFFDKEGNSHKELESRNVKGVSFMAFDILFGPETIDVSSDGTKIVGQEFSFIVPEDGKLRTMPWQYINRYDILYNLIMPTQMNKSEPILTEAFKGVNWFNIEVKPIYFLETLKDRQNIYNESGRGYLQTILSTERKNFYEYLHNKHTKHINIFTKKALKLDGLIFTASDTLYKIGSWDTVMTTQYKWKPANEQTVDLLINKTTNTSATVYLSIGGEIVPYQEKYNEVQVTVPYWVPDKVVAEFGLDKDGKFTFKSIRKDKNHPNALRTVLNVINSFKNPVDINDLYYFLNIQETSDKKIIKRVLQYASKTKLLQCITKKDSINILEPIQVETINNLIKSVNTVKDIEVELRFGIVGKTFNPRISSSEFINMLNKVESYGYKKEIEDFVDVYKDSVRTRYIFSKDFGKYIFYDSIEKSRKSNVDIIMKNIMKFDIRIAESLEKKVNKYNSEGDSYRKYRTSYTEPTGLFRIDFTSISPGIYVDRNFIPKDSSETYQIEIEFLSNNINVEELFKFISQNLAN
tara:strand:- start:3763 stop:5691 length:1929 start_codon:yes stop_codon:yes gene_type:complete